MFKAILSAARPSLQLLRDFAVRGNGFHSISTGIQSTGTIIAKQEPGGLFTQIRNKVRCYFPRPKETHRIRKHGWEHRLSTAGGRRVLMRRLLKGRHALSH